MPFHTLGPRGDVGINPIATGKDLASLSLLTEQARADKCTYRYHTRNDGTIWIEPCKGMGGRTRPNRKRLPR